MTDTPSPWVFCGRGHPHISHGVLCPGTGLCRSDENHFPHLVESDTLAPFWCLGDPEDRIQISTRMLADKPKSSRSIETPDLSEGIL